MMTPLNTDYFALLLAFSTLDLLPLFYYLPDLQVAEKPPINQLIACSRDAGASV